MKQRQREASPINLSWRIYVSLYETDTAFERLRNVLLDSRDIVDEVAFFETITHHLYFPLEVFARRAEILKARIRTLKADGLERVGINVLCTIGHMNEGWDFMAPLPFQAMIGHDGSVSRSCACPNTGAFREYVRAKYRLMAEAGPDFIWVDDDIRMHHHGVAWGCFCQTCLSLFSETTGQAWTRESLVAALESPEGGRVREGWVRQNSGSLESLMTGIRQAVRAVDPGVTTGLMTAGMGWTTYSGPDIQSWLTALGATKIRPGGGFYSDEQPIQMVHKALECGRQLAGVAETAADRQYELENFPYTPLAKSPATLVNECTLALASGMNGIAFNAMGISSLHLAEERRPLLEAVRAVRPYWERIARAAAGCPGAGLWPAWSIHTAARMKVHDGESWFGSSARLNLGRAGALAELGLPLVAEPSGDGVVLEGRQAEVFSDDELRRLFTGGVLMDAASLAYLHERGLGELAGVRVVRSADNGVKERFTADPLNGRYAGDQRFAMIEFWGDARGLGEILEPVVPGVRILAEMVTYLDTVYGPCMTAYENQLGGRVVVMGYAPWMFLGSSAKRTQLQNAADWITRGRVPVRTDETCRLVPFVRLSPDRRKGVVVMLNAGFDALKEATVHLRTEGEPLRLERPGKKRAQPVSAVREPGGWRFTLRDLPPWSTVAVIL